MSAAELSEALGTAPASAAKMMRAIRADAPDWLTFEQIEVKRGLAWRYGIADPR